MGAKNSRLVDSRHWSVDASQVIGTPRTGQSRGGAPTAYASASHHAPVEFMDMIIGAPVPLPSEGGGPHDVLSPANELGDEVSLDAQQHLAVLTDDDAEWQAAQACANELGWSVQRFLTGKPIMDAFKDGTIVSGNRATMPWQLLILGGNVPTWVHVEWAERLRLDIETRLAGAKRDAQRYVGFFPAVLVLTNEQGVASIGDYHLEPLPFDFQMQPINAAELTARLKRLMLGRTVSASGFQAMVEQEESEQAQVDDEFDTATLRDQLLNGPPRHWEGYSFYPNRLEVVVSGEVVKLPIREFAGAMLLFLYLGKPIPRRVFVDGLFRISGGARAFVSERAVDGYISKIRSKLNLLPGSGYALKSLYRVGYILRQSS